MVPGTRVRSFPLKRSSWRVAGRAATKSHRRNFDGSRTDQDTAGSAYGREARIDKQASERILRSADGDGSEGDEAERRIRNPRIGPPGKGRAQGAHGPQPADG